MIIRLVKENGGQVELPGNPAFHKGLLELTFGMPFSTDDIQMVPAPKGGKVEFEWEPCDGLSSESEVTIPMSMSMAGRHGIRRIA